MSGFAACKTCHKVLAFDSRKLGTSSLRKHVETCKSRAGPGVASATIDRYFAKGYKPPRGEDKEAITQLAVQFVCRDIRSFETVCGDGFLELAQGLIDTGARAGHVDELATLSVDLKI
ncbi:hypothetical protein DPEC_G00177750 [Dallia pectoralis]|uniref:Uncharacterized protein n=1 Tax=Dallia pectoralis TaxID=75939 RepID=A0ACC2GFA3_DALPE|nr:hypothetical protein DPEC_G00177750 [Dallia pectoralis]